jgi:hypothetical protein
LHDGLRSRISGSSITSRPASYKIMAAAGNDDTATISFEASGRRWSLGGMTALVTGGTRGIGCVLYL